MHVVKKYNNIETINMQPFEIHIYAIDRSTSKFKEFTPSTTDSLPSDLIKHIDGVWGMFPVGTYAVYYTEQAYILTLFSNFSSEGQLSVAVSVALRRGYVLKYPMEILNDLCVEFRKLAGEHRNDPEIAMYNNMPILNELVAKGVVAVPNQPVYNYGTGQCAVVGYNSSEELLSLLKHPSRKEFQNITYLYLLPKHEAARRWNVLSASFKAITNIDFDYNRTYKLRYPDGYQEEISGIDHEVNRDCEKAYCEPIKLHGNLKDHMGEWQVALSEDKTTYQIGLQFKPLQETYEIVSKEKGKVLSEVQYSASVGSVEGNMLTLVGEQTAQTPVLALCSGQHFKIEKQDFIPLSKQIIVNLSPLYRYDVQKERLKEDQPKNDVDFFDEVPVPINKFKAKWLPKLFNVAILLVGFVIGLFIYPLIFNHEERRKIVTVMSESKNEQKEENLKSNEIIARLKVADEETEKLIVKSKDDKNELDQLTPVSVEDERSLLVEKLRGTAFTMNDIKKLREMSPTNEEKKLLRSCEACLRLINYDIFNKKKVVKLIKDPESTGVNDHDERFIVYMYHDIIDVHKKAMDKIIKDYSKAYVTIDRIDFETLDEALDIYRSAYGGLYYE